MDTLTPRDDGAYHLALEHRGDHCVLRDLDVMEPAYGVAVDIGTTTVVVIVVELTTGRVVGSASALNAQTRLGDNVVTRINLCMKTPHIVQRMQKAIVRGTLSPLLAEALQEASIDPRQLACMVVAGNMTMLHLLHGVDPTSMGMAPFTPTFLEHRIVDASQLRLEVKSPSSRTKATTDPDAAVAARDAVGTHGRAFTARGSCLRGCGYHGRRAGHRHGLSRRHVPAGRPGHQRRDRPQTQRTAPRLCHGCRAGVRRGGTHLRHARRPRSDRSHLAGKGFSRGPHRSDWRHGGRSACAAPPTSTSWLARDRSD